MQTRRRDQFSTVRTEGPILPPDLLRRIADDDKALGGLTPEAYHLGRGERLNEIINRSWNRLLGAWATFRAGTAMLGETDAATGLTRDRWLYPLFQELGYGRLPPARGIEVDGTHYPISHAWGTVPIHLVGAGVDLDRRAAGVAGAARVSPHGLVQDLLNRSADHLWGFASNGLRLRVLRDNVSITRQSYVEWDLEAMMDGEVYADFALLWLVCHQSRVEAERPDEYWLEKWTRAAQEQGTRALDQLRGGVEQAITALGKGFLAHPANGDLREALQDGPASGGLDTQEYYRQLLRLVYRLLFLFVAEDRDVLLDPNAEPTARERYTSYYSTAKLRRLADRRVGTRHHDLYQGLRLVMAKLGDAGSPPLGLPALGGYLFSIEAVRDLAECEIANHDLLDAIRALAFVEDGRNRRLVDYRNLGAEELGSVYESLLELHPEIDSEAATFALKTASGNERKTTGSYYTPTSLIQCLLDSALDPVLEEAARKPDPEAAILDLKICDPACGSGHFLIAAAHRIAKRLAAIRTGEPEPSPEAVRTALRQVVGSCIYGVDLNPMAVELCKVSLWMEAVEPGKPLTFLDHHIQSGNSLLGTTPALLAQGIPDAAFTPIEGDDKKFCTEYRALNKKQRTGRISIAMFDADLKPWEHMGNLATAMLALDGEDADTIEGQRRKQERYEQMVRSDDYLYGRLLSDAWCAAFVWKKAKTPELPYPITDERLREIERSPFRVAPWMRDEIRRLAEQYRFFHWHLAFPDVFRAPARNELPENEQAGWSGGCDVVLGNPPWDRFKIPDKEWFAARRPDIVAEVNSAARDRAIKVLAETEPILFGEYMAERRRVLAQSRFFRASERYPLSGHGEVNTYMLFAEVNRAILGTHGHIGAIVPSGIATDETSKYYFQDLMRTKTLVSLYDFENHDRIFPMVDSRMRFFLLTLTGLKNPSNKGAKFAFFIYNTNELQDEDRRFVLSADDIMPINPNTLTCPTFRFRRDALNTISIYRRVPILVNEQNETNEWSVSFRQGTFNLSHDSHLFLDSIGPALTRLYEGRLIHQFTHRWVTYDGAEARTPDSHELSSPLFESKTRYWVKTAQVDDRLRGDWDRHWFFAFRDIARTTDERTTLFAVIPRVGVGHTAPLMLTPKYAERTPALFGCHNSFVLDYVARQKVGGTHLTYGYLRQFPVLPPDAYGLRDLAFIVPRVLELTYTAWDLEPFAKDVGYDGPPFHWDEDRRFLLRAELDALYFRLYGIERDDVDYIMETFPIVKRKDEQRHGSYRTKEAILAIYDALAEAERTGVPYQTRLEPPPADIRVAHPNRDGTPYTGPGRQPPAADTAAPRSPVELPAVATVSAPAPPATPAPPRAPAPARQRTVTRLPSQPTLLDRDPLFAEAPPSPQPVPPATREGEPAVDEQALRQRVLREAVEVLRTSGPLTARDLASRLAHLDPQIDRRLVNSVLSRDGAATVRYDAARYTYALR